MIWYNMKDMIQKILGGYAFNGYKLWRIDLGSTVLTIEKIRASQ